MPNFFENGGFLGNYATNNVGTQSGEMYFHSTSGKMSDFSSSTPYADQVTNIFSSFQGDYESVLITSLWVRNGDSSVADKIEIIYRKSSGLGAFPNDSMYMKNRTVGPEQTAILATQSAPIYLGTVSNDAGSIQGGSSSGYHWFDRLYLRKAQNTTTSMTYYVGAIVMNYGGNQ
jgi:hypothetical protein